MKRISSTTSQDFNPKEEKRGHDETLMTEPPFVPREKILEKQRYFQQLHKHTYLKGPMDKITSVAIPLALATTSVYLIARGIYNMAHGVGKKE